MTRWRWMHGVSLAAMLALTSVPLARAQSAAHAEFQRAYFLQHHDRDLKGAAAAYEHVLDYGDAPEPLRSEARDCLAACREDLVTEDFTRLMPPDVLAYAEISKPGEHFARLVKQLGLVRDAGAPSEPKPAATPLGEGAFFPHDFALSPALLEALKSVRGVAVAVTGLDNHDIPEGLLVIHPGDADLLRGLLATAIQFAEPAEPIEGFRTYALQGQAWALATKRLFLVARTREALAAAVARLQNPQAPSLANSDDLKSAGPDREGAMLFAYLHGPRALSEFRRRVHGREASMAAGVLDLEHVRSVSASMRAMDDGLQLQARLDLMEGHHNLAYALIRTAPCTRSSLEFVPGGAAAVALIGLNPASTNGAGGPPAMDRGAGISAMDIGREFFANLEEAAVFAAPTTLKDPPAGPPIPDVGIVLMAKDVNRSEALWSQLLALPALFLPSSAGSAKEITVEGTKATEYRYPNAPPIVLARVKDRAIVIGTAGAAASAIRSAADGQSIAQDAEFKPLLDRLTPHTSKAVLIHAGRATGLAAAFARGREAEQFRIAASMLTNLRIALVTDEQPTQFTARMEVTGLPNVPAAVRKFALLRQEHATHANHRVSEAQAQPAVAVPVTAEQ